MQKLIFTIGHSTHSEQAFIALLKAHHISRVVDIRSFPGSRKYPQFNSENMQQWLPEHGIAYELLKALGGRRKVQKDSHNTRWRNDSFRAYADYMETPEFEEGMKILMCIAAQENTAIMCSEAVWWRCHRSMVSDYLKAMGWDVQHIMSEQKTEAHPYTQPARVVGDKVFYTDKELFNPTHS